MIQITESTLPFLAGALAGAFDHKLGTGTAWTMKVFMDMQKGRLDLKYLERLEAMIRQRWPDDGTSPPTVQELSRPNSDPWPLVTSSPNSSRR